MEENVEERLYMTKDETYFTGHTKTGNYLKVVYGHTVVKDNYAGQLAQKLLVKLLLWELLHIKHRPLFLILI